MPDKKFIQYEHHGEEVWVREDLKGQHRDFCLCYDCQQFKPEDRAENCPAANMLFALDQFAFMVTPVWECSMFAQKPSSDIER